MRAIGLAKVLALTGVLFGVLSALWSLGELASTQFDWCKAAGGRSVGRDCYVNPPQPQAVRIATRPPN